MNTQKYKRGNINLLSEADRSLYRREDGAWKDTASKSLIDRDKTQMNYNLCPHAPYSEREITAIHERIRGKAVSARDNFFGMSVVTIPKDFEGDVREFFQSAYKGLKKIYGLEDDDVISAYAHMDETTPHIHFIFIPVHRQGEKVTVSWEKTMPLSKYRTQHKELKKIMEEDLGEEVNLLNGKTLGFDVQQLTQDQKKGLMELDRLKGQRNEVFERIAELESKRDKAGKDANYHYNRGDFAKGDQATRKWDECNWEIERLIPLRKELVKRVGEKVSEIAGTKNPTETQRAIIGFACEKIRLEDDIREVKKKLDEAREELKGTRAKSEKIMRDAVFALVDRVQEVSDALERERIKDEVMEEAVQNLRDDEWER